ncbi:MAG: M23 family metallopeptidase [Candidatus Paceibacterota bacterium]
MEEFPKTKEEEFNDLPAVKKIRQDLEARSKSSIPSISETANEELKRLEDLGLEDYFQYIKKNQPYSSENEKTLEEIIKINKKYQVAEHERVVLDTLGDVEIFEPTPVPPETPPEQPVQAAPESNKDSTDHLLIEYRREEAEIEERIRDLKKAIADFEIEEKKRSLAAQEPKGEKVRAPLQVQEQRTRPTRRSFLKKIIPGAIVAGAGGVALGKYIMDKQGEEGEEEKPPSKAEIKKTVAGEIVKCTEIIEGKQYEKILHNPYLVSALYYSEAAMNKMGPPHYSASSEIIWNIRPLITREFRESYMASLKMRIPIETSMSLIDPAKQLKPLEVISVGNDLSKNHSDALDLFTTEGSQIKAMLGGVVVLAEANWNGVDDMSTSSSRGGNSVIIYNPHNQSFYRYAHMKTILAQTGEVLRTGGSVGTVGSTGVNASKPGHGGHLHLEINQYNPERGTMLPVRAQEIKERIDAAVKMLSY